MRLHSVLPETLTAAVDAAGQHEYGVQLDGRLTADRPL